jgi:hypothetical protein
MCARLAAAACKSGAVDIESQHDDLALCQTSLVPAEPLGVWYTVSVEVAVDAREAWMRDQECERERPREDAPGVKATWEAAEGVLRCECEDGRALSSEDVRVSVL